MIAKNVEILLQNLQVNIVQKGTAKEITGLSIDSRKIKPGYLYAALTGTSVDGHSFIDGSIEKGAAMVLCSNRPEQLTEGIWYLQTPNVHEVLGQICGNFYDHPDKALTLVGTTGTNGKTTVSSLLFELYSNQGYDCGLISTVEYKIGKDVFPSTHTTPDIISLYDLLNQMVESGCTYCFMEVSSHAIDQKRIAGLQFAAAIFTNITHDHLDYHGTFAHYLQAKKAFFDHLDSSAIAITNKDDKNGLVMLQNCKASKYTYGLGGSADFTVKIIESDFNGMLLKCGTEEIWVSLVGDFNAYNLCAVYSCATLLGGVENLGVELSKLGRVNGRFEALAGPNKITAIVDYAHTPDALENVLTTINKIRNQNAQLITVVGCGGDRDKSKRPEMGKIAARMSTKVIFTSDNPRSEDPATIIDEMESGVEGQHYRKIMKNTDRKQAIRAAILNANPGDVVLVAGKGHETYQEIMGIKHPFDDKLIIIETFKQL